VKHFEWSMSFWARKGCVLGIQFILELSRAKNPGKGPPGIRFILED
jgi:hypothetical protein